MTTPAAAKPILWLNALENLDQLLLIAVVQMHWRPDHASVELVGDVRLEGDQLLFCHAATFIPMRSRIRCQNCAGECSARTRARKESAIFCVVCGVRPRMISTASAALAYSM